MGLQRMKLPRRATTPTLSKKPSTKKVKRHGTRHGCLFPNPQTPTCPIRPTENKCTGMEVTSAD